MKQSLYSDMKRISAVIIFLIIFSVYGYSQKTKPIDYSQKIIEAAPKPLPQTPVADRQTTDAQDANLKGKVKSVVGEREGLTGVEKPIGRRTSLFADFDEQGNYLREVYFEYRGRPYDVSVYGYIDGTRASLSNSINFGDEGLVALSEEKERKGKKLTPDLRYSLKYKYKYENEKLIEIQMIGNAGEKHNRIVYKYKGNQREESVYLNDGKLNRKYLYTFDDNGNEIERIDFDVRQPKPSEKSKFRYKYQTYDKEGNWTKRTFLQIEFENGKEVYKPLAVEYRAITYYP